MFNMLKYIDQSDNSSLLYFIVELIISLRQRWHYSVAILFKIIPLKQRWYYSMAILFKILCFLAAKDL